ncbi:DNA-binding transcriptional activator PunR [Ferrimonas senticii]|uniref:DNA-binding transcriptional activator PunR n=1 Tax=Ferrimonas senticii TaxID=394566 RepID=UPI0004265D24|nr:DNA-binding transcriptional activator PunR [Ferrimonas senticii]
MFSYQELQVVESVSRNGGFAAAADELHKVPSAVSYTVRQVEEKLGVVLFVRHHKSIEITPSGAFFVEEAREIISRLDNLKLQTRKVANGWVSGISIVIDHAISEDQLNQLIADFYAEYSDVELMISSRSFNGMWDAIANEQADVVLGTTFAVPIIRHLKHQKLARGHWKFVVAKEHPLAAETGLLTSKQIIQYPFIRTEDSSAVLFKHAAWQFDNQRRLTTPSWSSAIPLFVQGIGIGSMPSHLADPLIASGCLIEKPLQVKPEHPLCCVAWIDDKENPVRDWVVNYISRKNHNGCKWA